MALWKRNSNARSEGNGVETPEEAFKREKDEIRRGLNHWLRRCQSDDDYAHLEVNIDAFIKRLSDMKTADEVRLLRQQFNAFIEKVNPGTKRKG